MEPSVPDAESASMREMRDFLLRAFLRRYGHGDLRSSAYPGRGAALEVAETREAGRILRFVCDVWGIALGELASRARVEQTVVSRFVMDSSALSWEHTKALTNAVHDLVRERSLQPVDPSR